MDLHRPDAVRILDFPHALGCVSHAGQAVYGEGTAASTQWFAIQRQTLHAGNPATVLEVLRQLAVLAKRRRAVAALPTIQERRHYLEKRRGMLDYAWYQARGYLIGSGSVESANKLVVERRLKGTGMHWARAYVTATVALRTIACSDRRAEAWLQSPSTSGITPGKVRSTARYTDDHLPAQYPWLICPPLRPCPVPPQPPLNRCRCYPRLRRPRCLHLRLPSRRIARPLTTRGGASA